VFACDGHDPVDIDRAITAAKAAGKPALVDCRTHIALGSSAQDTSKGHGALTDAKLMADAKAAEKGTRTQLITRLYAAMAHKAESELAYAGEVTNWVVKDPKADTPKSKVEAKPDPRYEKGNFVFFVTVHNPETGNYHVVQGNQFDQAYEQQLLASIADRMAVDTTELSHAVQGLEKSLGFGASTAASKEVATA
jgi:transketolase